MSFFTKNESVKSRVGKILEELIRIAEALRQAGEDQQSARADEASAVATLGTTEAALALGEETGDIEAARKAVKDARQQLENIEARRVALESRQQLRQDQLLELDEPLNGEKVTERNARVESWLRDFDRQLAAFRSMLFRGLALGVATDWDTGHYLTDAHLRDPRDTSKEVLNLRAVTEYIELDGQTVPTQVEAWRTDPAALKLYEEVEPEFSIYRQAATVLDPLRRKRTEAEAAAARGEGIRKMGVSQ